MRFNLFSIRIFGVTLSTLLFTSLCFVGCGAFEDDNGEPSIGGITDKTLNVGAETTVEVTITDTDFRDTHSIRASSDDTAIATVSVNDTTLTISTFAEGVTTITVAGTDDSGQDNATTTPVTFQVFVAANSQPVINKPIPDMTLTAGTGVEVEVSVTDADVDDTHTVNASSDNSTVVDLGNFSTILKIYGQTEGVAIVTASVYDDSGVNNAKSTPVTFQVTVEPYVNKGRCAVGMVLEAGESCTYFADGAEVLFYVDNDAGCRGTEAEGKRLRLCVSPEIERDDFFNTRFAAEKNRDGSWTVKRIPWLN